MSAFTSRPVRTLWTLAGFGALAASLACNDRPANDGGNASGSADTTADAGLAGLTSVSHGTTRSELSAAAKAPSMSLQPAGSQTGDAIETGLRAAAAKAAPDMQPDGPLARAELAMGGHATTQLTLHAGRCYALVGFGSGVQDLDLHLLTPPNYDVVSAQDESDDNTPVIGRAPHPLCPATDVGLPFKLDTFAESGGGSVGVQLYSKAAPSSP